MEAAGSTLTLVLARHGATTWNDNGYCQGRKDVPLSPRGTEQAERLRDTLAGTKFDHVFASPLVRARETARIVTGKEPEIVEDLIEIDRGHWEGHSMEEARRRWGGFSKGWYDDPAGLAMPGGEAFDDLWERAGRALEAITARDGVAFACAHKALNRVLIARALGLPSKGVWGIRQPQACRSVLIRGDGWRAESIGDAAHLPDELRSDR